MGEAGFAAFGRNGLWFTPEPGLNADRAQSLRRHAHRGCRLFVHTARQDQEALAARLENEIHGPILITYALHRGRDRCLAARRSVVDLPLENDLPRAPNPFLVV